MHEVNANLMYCGIRWCEERKGRKFGRLVLILVIPPTVSFKITLF
jgi:hypothetical protein